MLNLKLKDNVKNVKIEKKKKKLTGIWNGIQLCTVTGAQSFYQLNGSIKFYFYVFLTKVKLTNEKWFFLGVLIDLAMFANALTISIW